MSSTHQYRVIRGLLIAGCAALSLMAPAAHSQPRKVVSFPVTVVGGYANSDDPRFYTEWEYNESFLKAMTADPDPVIAANKRAMMGLEADLGRAVLEKRMNADADAIIDRYTTTDYRQMDPNIPDGRHGLSEWLKAGGMHKGGPTETPPPPIALIADRNSVAMILKLPPSPAPDDPSKLYSGYLISVFQVRDGRLSAHYDSSTRGAYWCRIGCGPKKH